MFSRMPNELCRAYVLWIGRPRKYRYSLAVGISQMLFLTEGFTITMVTDIAQRSQWIGEPI